MIDYVRHDTPAYDIEYGGLSVILQPGVGGYVDLLIEIARCPNVTACLTNPSRAHSCADVVRSQKTTKVDHQLPEPWSGDLEHAPILFVSSNPSIADESHDFYPRTGWSDAKIRDYFQNRFGGGRTTWVSAEAYRSVQYWAEVRGRASELLGRDARPGLDFALTEVVHCKSRNNVGVDSARDECSRRYLGRVLECSRARVIVVLGKHARTAVERHLCLQHLTNPVGPIRIGQVERYIAFLGQPGSSEARTFARCLPDSLATLQTQLTDSGDDWE